MKKSLVAISVLIFMMIQDPSICQSIIINEIISSNSSSIHDEDGDTPDWIELYNPAAEPVDLSGLALSDDPADPLKWVFPDKMLDPYAYLVVYASGKDRDGSGQWETLINRGDPWKYYVPQGEIPGWRLPEYDDTNWPSGPSGFGYGDDDDATILDACMSVYIRKTFTTDELPAILQSVLHVDYDDGFVAYLNGTEIARANIGNPGEIPAFDAPAINAIEPVIYQGGYPSAFPVNPDLLNDGTNVIAIEVHNITITSSDLTLIPFFSVLLETAPPNPSGSPPLLQLANPRMHTNFRISSSGETICLSNTSGTITDSVFSDNLPVDISKGRQPDGSNTWRYFTEPTPEAPNSTQGWPGITSSVQFSQPAGFYQNGIQIVLYTDTPGDAVYYTVDGSEPDQSSTIYSTPIFLFQTTVIRAIAVHDGFLPGKSITATYFINTSHDLPVFSLSTAPGNLFDPVIGIYNDNNVWQDWERPVHIEFYDSDDTSGFSMDAGIKLYGAWTRTLPQKSLALYARESYGYGNIDYPLFPDLPYDSYESFILRNSGNDWNNTMFRDGLLTGLVKNDETDIQAFRPSVVYINGDYWGIYNMREKLTDQYIEQHYGYPKDSIDLLELNGNVLNGNANDYNQMITFIDTHPMSDPANYVYIKTKIDIPEFITYEIAQIYFANTDWPGNNIKYWRPRTPDGKWRWMLYDTDFGFGLATDYTHNTLVFATDSLGPDWPNPPWSTFLLRKLLTNSEFITDFINRYADLINSSFRQNTVIQQIDGKKSAIINEMPNQFTRWGSDMWTWLNNVQVMRDFGNLRVNNAQNHVIQYFDLAGISDVTLDVSPAASGRIDISTLHLSEFPWTGEYFNGVPVKISAYANPGYRFVGWEGDYVTDTNSFTIIFTHDMELTAVFEAYTPDWLVINEINYNSSLDFIPEDWVEIYNPYSYQVSLDNWSFKDKEDIHEYYFTPGTVLGSNGFLVLCSDTAEFHALFPDVTNYTGDFDFKLDGGGELLRLYDFSGLLIDTVHYDDEAPWPAEPDGNGPTLELIDPALDNALPESWTAYEQHGTPGGPNGIYISVEEKPDEEPGVIIVPNPFKNSTSILLVSSLEQLVTIDIFNINGMKVMTFPMIQLAKGTHKVDWDGCDNAGKALPKGVYICRVSSDKQVISRKVVKVE